MSEQININIHEGEPFFAHEVTVNFTPTQLAMDFKCITPRTDPRSKKPSFQLKAKSSRVLFLSAQDRIDAQRPKGDAVTSCKVERQSQRKPIDLWRSRNDEMTHNPSRRSQPKTKLPAKS